MKRLLHWLSPLVLVAGLLLNLLPQPVKAIDACSTNVAQQNPTSNSYDQWFASPHNVYVSTEQYYLYFQNNSSHTCHLIIDLNVTTSNGWKFDDYHNWNSNKAVGTPWVTFNGGTCVFNDGATQKSITCERDVPNLGNIAQIVVHWIHPSPLNSAQDTNSYTMSIHDPSDGYDYVLLNGTTTIH